MSGRFRLCIFMQKAPRRHRTLVCVWLVSVGLFSPNIQLWLDGGPVGGLLQVGGHGYIKGVAYEHGKGFAAPVGCGAYRQVLRFAHTKGDERCGWPVL